MRNRLLAVIVLMACSCFAAMAQGRNSIVKYVTENNLYRSGNDVTVTNIDVEWPASLDGNGMPALQKRAVQGVARRVGHDDGERMARVPCLLGHENQPHA